MKAVELLESIGTPAWKVGSGEIRSNDLLEAMLETKKPILLSSGLADYKLLNDNYFIQSRKPCRVVPMHN